jgi:biotin carboxylase
MLTKTGAAAVFDLAGVRRAPKADAPLDGPLPAEPPFVVKPDFGFGSQLVKVVRDEAQWRAYADVARTPSGVRARYGRAYFADEPGLLDRFVAEPLLDGTFLSVPFVWDGAAVTAFPVSGAEAASTASTDFHWERFEAPARIDPAAFAALESDLARLAGPCELRPGVFEAELLLLAGGELCFLEFSPRPTGGVVPELVWHAYGVDIDELAVRCFLGERPAVARDAARPVLGVRSPAAAPPDESLELLSEQAGAGGRLVDRVYAAA